MTVRKALISLNGNTIDLPIMMLCMPIIYNDVYYRTFLTQLQIFKLKICDDKLPKLLHETMCRSMLWEEEALLKNQN